MPDMELEEAMPDKEWRESVDTQLVKLSDDVKRLDNELKDNRKAIAENTEITRATKAAFERFEQRAMPAVEVTETMMRGAAAMGRMIEFANRWSRRISRFAMLCLGMWLAAKIVFAGGDWVEAVKAFFSVQVPHS